VGQAPDGLFLGNFTGTGTEIAALNGGSNTISLIGQNGVIETVPAGGLDPSSGFAGDFTANGFSDLVVGNLVDGHLALLLGGPTGLTLGQSLESASVPSPTSLSFAGVSGGVLSFYAASAGREAASLLAFNLNQPESQPGSLPGDVLAVGTVQSVGAVLASATTGTFQQVAQLLGSGNAALGLIAPLFTVSVSAEEFGREPEGVGGVVLLANFLPGTGNGIVTTQSQILSSAADAAVDETGEKPRPAKSQVATAGDEGALVPLWERIVSGLDRAWEQARTDLLKKAGINPRNIPVTPAPTRSVPPAEVKQRRPGSPAPVRRPTPEALRTRVQRIPEPARSETLVQPRTAFTRAVDVAIEVLITERGDRETSEHSLAIWRSESIPDADGRLAAPIAAAVMASAGSALARLSMRSRRPKPTIFQSFVSRNRPS
jgi:hypothetical protein